MGINPDFEMDIVGDYTVRCVGSGSTVPTTFTDELMHLKFEGIHVGWLDRRVYLHLQKDAHDYYNNGLSCHVIKSG